MKCHWASDPPKVRPQRYVGDSCARGEVEGEGEKEMRRGDKDLGWMCRGKPSEQVCHSTTWPPGPCTNGGECLRQTLENTEPTSQLKQFYCHAEDGVKSRETVEHFLRTLQSPAPRQLVGHPGDCWWSVWECRGDLLLLFILITDFWVWNANKGREKCWL